MSWLKAVLTAILAWFKGNGGKSMLSTVSAIEGKIASLKNENASKRYTPIKTFSDNDPDYVKSLAITATNEAVRYFLFDMREEFFEKGDLSTVKALTEITKRLRVYEMTAIAGGLHGV